MGDLNAEVRINIEGVEKANGKHEIRTRNDNGERLVELCIENEMVIGEHYLLTKNVIK